MAKSLVIWVKRAGHTGPLTVNKIWRCRRGIGEYGVIFMLLLEEIRLHLGYKGSQRVLI